MFIEDLRITYKSSINNLTQSWDYKDVLLLTYNVNKMVIGGKRWEI